MIKIKVKFVIVVFFALLMYSNLLSRVTGFNLNGLFYLAFFLVFIWSALSFPITTTPWKIVYFLLVALMILYIFDLRFNFSENLLSIKDFIIPALSLLIGYRLAKNSTDLIDSLNYLYLPFVSYGILQELLFYSAGLPAISKFLPWDFSYLNSIIVSQGGRNFFQGTLLRFFGVMNSFVEYQIWVMGIAFFLWVNINLARNRKLVIANLILMAVFLGLSLERSPIGMAIILFIAWKFKYILSRFRRILLGSAIILAVAFLFVYFGQSFIVKNPLLANAYVRLNNLVTLNFAGDATIQSRLASPWAIALQATRGAYFGVGLGTVTPSAYEYPGYIGPHNNFLAFYMGYGALGLGFLLLLLAFVAFRFSRLSPSFRYFGYGIIISFSALAMFNMPFSGKQGILFYFIIGYLLSLTKLRPEPVEGQPIDRLASPA